MAPVSQKEQLKILMAPVYDTDDPEWHSIELSAHKREDVPIAIPVAEPIPMPVDKTLPTALAMTQENSRTSAAHRGFFIQAIYHGSTVDIHKEIEGDDIERMSEIWDKFDQSIRARRYEAHEQFLFEEAANEGKPLRYIKKTIPTALNQWQEQQLIILMDPEVYDTGGSKWQSVELTAHKRPDATATPKDKKNRNLYSIQAVYHGPNDEPDTVETEHTRLIRAGYIWDQFEESIRAWGYKPQAKLSYGVALDAGKWGKSLTYTKTIPTDDENIYENDTSPIAGFLHSIWVHIIGVSFSIIGVFVVFQTLCCVIMRKKESKSSDKGNEKMSRMQRMWRLRAIRKMQRKCRSRTTLRRQRMSISITMLETQRLGTSRLILRMPRTQKSRQRMQRVWKLRQSRERRAYK